MRNPIREIVEHDSEMLLRFLQSFLNPSCYKHCVIVQAYLSFLEKQNIAFDPDLRTRFLSETYCLSQLLFNNLKEQVEMGFEEYEQHKLEAIKTHFANYSFADYTRFFESVKEIIEQSGENYGIQQLRWSIGTVLITLADKNPDLFRKVVKRLLQTGNQLRFIDPRVIHKLLSVYRRVSDAYKLIKRYNYNLKARWLFAFLSVLGEKNINRRYLGDLYDLYTNAPLQEVPDYFDHLESYSHMDRHIFVNVINILLSRSNETEGIINFHQLLNPHSEICARLSELFAGNLDLLKRIYFHQLKIDLHSDYNLFVFKIILENDANFILEYLDWMYEQHEYLSRHDNIHSYAFLWKLDNYEEIFSELLNFVYTRERARFSWGDSYIETFFKNSNSDELVDQRIQDFLARFIENHNNDSDLMNFIFAIIANTIPHKRKQFFQRFLQNNKDFEAFRILPVQPSSWSFYGSEIPIYEERIGFLESLLPLMSTPDLLKHRSHIEKQILYLKNQIEQENKRNFINEF